MKTWILADTIYSSNSTMNTNTGWTINRTDTFPAGKYLVSINAAVFARMTGSHTLTISYRANNATTLTQLKRMSKFFGITTNHEIMSNMFYWEVPQTLTTTQWDVRFSQVVNNLDYLSLVVISTT